MRSLFQFVAWSVLLLTVSVAVSNAQVVNSGSRTVALNATLSDSLTVSLSSNAVSLVLTAGSATNAGSTGITATTTWVSRPGKDVRLFAYFASAISALSDGAGGNIPSSAFSISNNGGAYAPLSNTVPFGAANAGLQLFTVKVTGQNKTGSHVDNMLFNLNLSALPQLQAGTYAGTLNIQAQVI
jgi:hypothetical protein